mgnify:CR=1 FL=1
MLGGDEHGAPGARLRNCRAALRFGQQGATLAVAVAAAVAFGLLAGVLVWRTGGLEAGIAAHVVNNVCAYLLAGLTTSIAALKARRLSCQA